MLSTKKSKSKFSNIRSYSTSSKFSYSRFNNNKILSYNLYENLNFLTKLNPIKNIGLNVFSNDCKRDYSI